MKWSLAMYVFSVVLSFSLIFVILISILNAFLRARSLLNSTRSSLLYFARRYLMTLLRMPNVTLSSLFDFASVWFYKLIWGGFEPVLSNPVPLDEAMRAAEDRRKFLSEFVSGNPSGEDYSARETLESPPGSPFIEHRMLDLRNSRGQLVRLKWQLSRDELLLTERVIDTIHILARGKQIRIDAIGNVSLRYRHHVRGVFPWQVCIEIHLERRDRAALKAELRSLRKWLAVEIAFVTPRQYRSYRNEIACRSVSARSGTIEGLLRFGSNERLMTCAHVFGDGPLSRPSCIAVNRIAGMLLNVDDVRYYPDSVLINNKCDCISLDLNRQEVCRPASDFDIREMHKWKIPVTYFNRGGRQPVGRVHTQSPQVRIENVVYRFPHVEIEVPLTSVLDLFYWPIFGRDFSHPGNSGGWIVETLSRRWVGMIAGGDPRGLTIAIESTPMLEYFRPFFDTLEVECAALT